MPKPRRKTTGRAPEIQLRVRKRALHGVQAVAYAFEAGLRFLCVRLRNGPTFVVPWLEDAGAEPVRQFPAYAVHGAADADRAVAAAVKGLLTKAMKTVDLDALVRRRTKA